MKLLSLAVSWAVTSLAITPLHAEPTLPKYRVEVIKGGLANSGLISGVALNNFGDVTGYARYGRPRDDRIGSAFIYEDGDLQKIALLAGMYSWGQSINDRGEVAGYAVTNGGEQFGFLYGNGHLTNLKDSSLPRAYGDAVGINQSGQVLVNMNGQ